MNELKGTVKITENEIVIKTEKSIETYIKKNTISSKKWINYKGEVWQITEIEDLDVEDEYED